MLSVVSKVEKFLRIPPKLRYVSRERSLSMAEQYSSRIIAFFQKYVHNTAPQQPVPWGTRERQNIRYMYFNDVSFPPLQLQYMYLPLRSFYGV
jgi:hypothetical protein